MVLERVKKLTAPTQLSKSSVLRVNVLKKFHFSSPLDKGGNFAGGQKGVDRLEDVDETDYVNVHVGFLADYRAKRGRHSLDLVEVDVFHVEVADDVPELVSEVPALELNRRTKRSVG